MRHYCIAQGKWLRRRRVLANLLRDGFLVDADQRLAGHAVKNITPSGYAYFRDGRAKLAVVFQIKPDHGARRIIIPQVVMHLLKVPAVLARLCLDGKNGHREQVIAFAQAAVEIRRGVAGREINQAMLRIDRGRLPHHGAALPPHCTVLRPALVTHLTGSGYGVERPQGLAILRAEGSDTASGGELASGKAADNHPVVVERPARDGEPLLPPRRLYRPQL